MLWLIVAPLIFILYGSLTSEPGKLPFEQQQLSFDNYVHVARSLETYKVLGTTAVFAVGSTTIGIVIAVFMAWLIERTDMWLRRAIFILILLPTAVPSMIYAMAWIQLLDPNSGFVNVVFRNAGLGFIQFSVYSLASMVCIQGFAIASHAYLLIAISLRTFDGSWEEQSYICGHRAFATLRRVVLPMLKPALFAAAVFFLVVSIETFDIPVTLGLTSHIRVLSTQVYWLTHPEGGGLPQYGMASTLSFLLIGIALLLIQAYQRQTRNATSFITITGKGYRPGYIRLGHWRPILFCVASFLVFVSVILPLAMLIWRSLLAYYMFPSLRALNLAGLGAYRNLFADDEMPRVLMNTVVVAGTSAVAAVILAAGVAWLVVRGSSGRGVKNFVSGLAFLPQALPSVAIGLALILVYIFLPVGIYGTVWILVVAMITKYIAFSAGSMIAAQMQIASDLEEASRVSGATAGRTYRLIVAPLIWPAVTTCFLWVFIHVVRELGLSLMLYSNQSEVLATKIWLLWENGRASDAAAAGVMTVLVLLLGLCLPSLFGLLGPLSRASWRRLRTPRPGAAFGGNA